MWSLNGEMEEKKKKNRRHRWQWVSTLCNSWAHFSHSDGHFSSCYRSELKYTYFCCNINILCLHSPSLDSFPSLQTCFRPQPGYIFISLPKHYNNILMRCIGIGELLTDRKQCLEVPGLLCCFCEYFVCCRCESCRVLLKGFCGNLIIVLSLFRWNAQTISLSNKNISLQNFA